MNLLVKNRIYLLLIGLLLLTGCRNGHQRLNALMKEGKTGQKVFSDSVAFVYKRGFVLVQVHANGRPFRFLLDSGAPTVLSAQTAAKLGTTTLFEYLEQTEGELKSQEFVRLDSVRIGKTVFENTGAVIDRGTEPFLFDSLRIDGIIGANLMQHACWQIDYKARIIRIMDGKTNYPDIAGAMAVPFSRNVYRAPRFGMLLNRSPGKVITRLSTGFNGALKLSRADFDQHAIAFRFYDTTRIDIVHNNGSDGISYLIRQGKVSPDVARFLTTRFLRIGAIEAENVPTVYRRGKYAYLGNAFLEDYLLTIDWKQRKFYLEEKN